MKNNQNYESIRFLAILMGQNCQILDPVIHTIKNRVYCMEVVITLAYHKESLSIPNFKRVSMSIWRMFILGNIYR